MTLKGLSEKKAGILEPMRPTQWQGTGSKCDLWALQVLDYIDTAYKWYLDQQSKMQSKNKARYMYVACLCNVMWIQCMLNNVAPLSLSLMPGNDSIENWWREKKLSKIQIVPHCNGHADGRMGRTTDLLVVMWSCRWHLRSGEKTFQSLFFPEKARLVRLVTGFVSFERCLSEKRVPPKRPLPSNVNFVWFQSWHIWQWKRRFYCESRIHWCSF